MCIYKAWNSKHGTTEMTTTTNEGCKVDYLKIAIWWGGNETFDSERFKSIKGNFSYGRNE